jgi:hypothetical protein
MTNKRLSGWAYLWIAVPLAVGLGTCAGGFVSMFSGVEDMPRAPASGGTVELDAGEYTVFFETSSVIDGRVLTVAGQGPSSCDIVSADTGEPVPVQPSSSSSSYAFGSYSGASKGKVDVPRAGTYRVTCAGGTEGAIAFGSGLFAMILLCLAGGLVALVGSVVIWIVVHRKRRPPPITGRLVEPPDMP